jgi:hypothetical protein
MTSRDLLAVSAVGIPRRSTQEHILEGLDYLLNIFFKLFVGHRFVES